jgi:hypothetical protein
MSGQPAYGSEGLVIGSGDVLFPTFVGNKLSTVICDAAHGTTPQTLLTGAPYYYITRFYVTVDPICYIQSAGMMEVVAYDSVVGVIGRTRVYMPSNGNMGQANATPSLVTKSDYGFFYLSPNAGSVVTVYPSVPLLGSGIIRVTANYGLTNIQAT